MQFRNSVCASLALGLIALLPQTNPANREMVLNINGWNLPDTTKLVLEKVETITLPGIPLELIAESWKPGKDASYRIINPPPWRPKPSALNVLFSEEVRNLVIFRESKDKTLCIRYTRVLESQGTGLPVGVISTFISDLDDDGKYEFQMGGGYEAADKKLLISILRIKLGLSEEADLVRRIIGSALREMGK